MIENNDPRIWRSDLPVENTDMDKPLFNASDGGRDLKGKEE